MLDHSFLPRIVVDDLLTLCLFGGCYQLVLVHSNQEVQQRIRLKDWLGLVLSLLLLFNLDNAFFLYLDLPFDLLLKLEPHP